MTPDVRLLTVAAAAVTRARGRRQVRRGHGEGEALQVNGRSILERSTRGAGV
jgi:hypothetical protein